MQKSSVLPLMLLCLAVFGGGHKDVRLSPEDANSFGGKVRRSALHKLFGINIYHECYVEGCSFEEVNEVDEIPSKQKKYEYYYTYTCSKFGRHCKVPCTYRDDCSFGSWGSWQGNIKVNNPGCYKQTRSKPYNHPLQTVMRRHGCGGLNTNCAAPPVQSRMQCVCKKANCQPGSWKQWSGVIKQGTCGTQTRIKPQILTWTTIQKTGSCSGVQTSCPEPAKESRKMCSCSKAECSLGDWSEWEGKVEQGRCGTQKRRRVYTKETVYEQHDKQCPSLPQNCLAPVEESRAMCSCKYATCSLDDWSQWEPQELEHGKCGQQQTRKKTYSLTWAYQSHAEQCPSLPQTCPDDIVEKRTQCKCVYRDSCDVRAWSEWDKPLTEEGCQVQTRTRSYVYPLKHSVQKDCSGLLTSCITEPKESRNYCKCKHVACTLAEWSNWSSAVLAVGQCGKEKRIRHYVAEEKFTFAENCDGLTTSCPASQEESRTMCKCPYVTCDISDWNPWQGALPADSCAQQIRTKNVTEKQHEKIQAANCDGLQTNCPPIPQETRQWCNCSFRENCLLNDWSDWTGKIPNGGCAVQIRTRDYNKSIEYFERETCDGLDSCPVIREETRTKCNCNEVICSWGNWTRTNYNPETNCYQEIRVKNESSGFKVVEQSENCDGISIQCSSPEIEKREDCISGGGGHVIHTSEAPPTTEPSTTTVAPTTGFQPATFVSLGCFADTKDKNKHPRAMPILYANFRSSIDWYDLSKTVQACAEEAKTKRLEYFSVQFYGECWSGANSKQTFAKYGESDKCYQGVGMEKTNAVYRLENMPACSSELQFSASVSTGDVNGHTWCAGDAAEYQWIVVDLGGERKITGVGTQGGNVDSWVTLYKLEWSEEGGSWKTYHEGDQEIFPGNSDRFTLETQWLIKPITAGFLRFKPLSWTSTHVCMKIKVYGCAV